MLPFSFRRYGIGSGGHRGLECVGCGVRGVGGHVRRSGGMARRTRDTAGRGILGRTRGGMGGDRRGARRSAGDFSTRPCACRFDGFPGAVILRMLVLKAGEHVLCAVGGPERQGPLILLDDWCFVHGKRTAFMSGSLTASSRNREPAGPRMIASAGRPRNRQGIRFHPCRIPVCAEDARLRMKYRTYLLLGAPGSGKGTQGKILGNIPRFFHLSMGDVFRALDTRTAIGQKFIDYSSRGQLVPDEITMELLRAHIGHLVGIHAFKPDIDALVLDGVPRNVGQAKIMADMIDVRRVFHLSCPDREQLVIRLRKRALKENRFDDANEETIRRRLVTYEAESKPLLDFYGAKRVKNINALVLPINVVKEIVGAICDDK